MAQNGGLFHAVKYPLIIALIKSLMFMVRILPWRLTRTICAGLGGLAFHLIKKERIKTISNLTIAYGHEKSLEEIRKMAKEVFVNLGYSVAELLIKFDIDEREKFFKNVSVEGEENARKAYEKGNGVVIIVPHLGCWEVMPLGFTLMGFKAGAVGKPLKNERLNKLVMDKRQRKGFKMLPRGTGYKAILNFLKENNGLGMLIDQDTSVKGVFVDFYGKPAYTPIGAAMLALDADASVLTVAYIRQPGNTYKFIISEPMDAVRTGDRQEELQINTEIFHKSVEKLVKAYPTQWVWMHERWKTTPEILEQKAREKKEKRRAAREM